MQEQLNQDQEWLATEDRTFRTC